jgi:hypothetical protein
MVSSSSRSAGTTRFTSPSSRARPGIDEFARDQHLEGLLARDVARQRHHRGRAEKPDIDPVDPEARALGGHGQIAARHQLAARRGGDAVHLGDHRLRQGGDRLHHRRAAREEIGEIGRAAIGGLASRRHFLQVVARAERLARAADRDDPDRGIPGQPLELGAQRRQHRVRKRVQLLRHVQRQPRHRAAVLAFQNCHLVLPPVSPEV